MNWERVPDEEKHAVAINNYQSWEVHSLALCVGDAVVLCEWLGDWYYGYKRHDKTRRGIFPKCFVAMRDNPETQLPLVLETTAVLHEWGDIFKDLYVKNDGKFRKLQAKMYELMRYRSEILSGTLPQDELRDMERRVASKIDLGNDLLELDMVVRDENCNILNPENTSTVQLFWQHQKATADIKKSQDAISDTQRQQRQAPSSNQLSHCLFLAVRNFVCKVSDDVELQMALYDGKENAPFSENYVVNWNNANPLQSHRVLFTDLGSRDLVRDKVYLVCYVIRVGAMDWKEQERETNRRNTMTVRRAAVTAHSPMAVRRPFGVAAMDITLIMSGNFDFSEDDDIFINFLPCEKDNLEQTLKRVLVLPKDHKGQGLWVSLKLLHGDMKQVREENPHLVLGNIAISRKMGFPEVILPGDVRNDLYLTLIAGEFSKGAKTSDKNVQVSVTVCNDKGVPFPNVIYLGGGVAPVTEFKSVVYYHEDRPKWNEIFKVSVPIEEFKNAHVKFTFRHRSSNEAKDKSEKPFAMSYVKLMQDNGTTLSDTTHSLCVYKLEHKKWDNADTEYLQLPWARAEGKAEKKEEKRPGLLLVTKDVFHISTVVCSTKLTQNENLLGLLNWADKKASLEQSLRALMQVDGEEVVKYLQDVLDALFNILMHNSDSELYDDIVFRCLVFIIGLVADRKYQHFEPVMNVYIEESFSATLAYNKLMIGLKMHIDQASSDESDKHFVLKVMKGLQYIFRFIVRSRLLFSELYGGKGQEPFEDQLKSLLNSIVELCSKESPHLVLVQGACLKYLPTAVFDIIKVFDPRELSSILANLIQEIPSQKLMKQKVMTVNDLVNGPLFLRPEARAIILPAILKMLKSLLDNKEEGPGLHQQTKSAEKLSRVLGASRANWVRPPYCRETEMELCVKVLSDMMVLLFRSDIGDTSHDITNVMLTVLRTVIQASISLNRDHPNVAPLVVVMLSVFRQMTGEHFDAYVRHFPTEFDRRDFLMEILLVFKDLVSKPVFPKDWCEMIMLQNNVILKALRFFSHTIRDYFFKPFEHDAWNNFFHCAISFLTQPSLQLEKFSPNKQLRISSRYKDMRRDTGFEIRSMWFNLGQYKIQFVPSLVGIILEMTLIPEVELRTATIPIFFDMMQCEYYSSKDAKEVTFSKRDSVISRGNFQDFENEMIAKLDVLFEGGCGDAQYKDLLRTTMLRLCEQHAAFRTQGVKFVYTMASLMERLLEYRTIITDENKENRMSCVVNLLDFYSEINRKEMYIRYVYKLCELHLESENYTEAACTLQLHAALLSWTDDALAPHLKSPRHPASTTHFELKEALYIDSINYFDKGKMWERALVLCNELKEQYQDYLYEYIELSHLYKKMANFYESIMKSIRPSPRYFRVGFYGLDFPAYLQNKVFIYRGKEFEQLGDFNDRILNQFPNAELMITLEPPSAEIMDSKTQKLQINVVDPMLSDNKILNSRAPEQILRYHRKNDVVQFQYSRPVYIPKGTKDFANMWLERTTLVTTYQLPGILMWFPVRDTTLHMVSPVENAIESMQLRNKELHVLFTSHVDDPNLDIKPLSMKIHGIVDPAVMGGIANYEKAFFTPEYLKTRPEDAKLVEDLKRCIAEQVPLVSKCLEIHAGRVSSDLQGLHDRLEECFKEMKQNVESKYGIVHEDELNLRKPSTRRQVSIISNGSFLDSGRSSINRLSPISLESNSSGYTGLKSISLMSLKSPVLATGTIKKDKNKDKRKSKSASKDMGTVQWYTGPEISAVSTGNQTLFELRQELQPKRPLRSEVEREKRLSRPNSGQFRPPPTNPRLSQYSGNRDSTGTTESTTSEDDPTPPPLPVKLKNSPHPADYDTPPTGPPPKPPLMRGS